MPARRSGLSNASLGEDRSTGTCAGRSPGGKRDGENAAASRNGGGIDDRHHGEPARGLRPSPVPGRPKGSGPFRYPLPLTGYRRGIFRHRSLKERRLRISWSRPSASGPSRYRSSPAPMSLRWACSDGSAWRLPTRTGARGGRCGRMPHRVRRSGANRAVVPDGSLRPQDRGRDRRYQAGRECPSSPRPDQPHRHLRTRGWRRTGTRPSGPTGRCGCGRGRCRRFRRGCCRR